MKTPWVIDVQNLTKSFANFPVVKGLSIQVGRGQVFGFLGANGSGKTTSIRMICGLLTPDSGQGQCIGYDVIQASAAIKTKVGYMPQKFSLYAELSVQENLAFIANLYMVKSAKQQILKVMQRLDLSERAHQLAGHLSGGWKQRLAFAACLVHEPELLLLDEPTAGIDPLARRDFWDVIHQLSQEGVTTLMSTHYMDEAERCHSLAYLANGKVLVQGSVNEVIQSTGIHTFLLEGDLPVNLLAHLKSLSTVVQAAWFGRGFHVCGLDAVNLSQDLKRLAETYGFRYQAIPPSLEDAFIALGRKG